MKTIAALIAGLLLSAVTFAGGIIIALIYLDAGEVKHHWSTADSTVLWTTEPVKVDRNPDTFQRLAARPIPDAQKLADVGKTTQSADPQNALQPAADRSENDQGAVVDATTTGSVEPDPSGVKTSQNLAHVEWCAHRYRSYHPDDNTYQPYGGQRRDCESPYSTVAAIGAASDTATQEIPMRADADDTTAEVEQAAYDEAPDAYLDGDHAQSCFERYRSYRPEDNSYQPFDGGPRRQCE